MFKVFIIRVFLEREELVLCVLIQISRHNIKKFHILPLNSIHSVIHAEWDISKHEMSNRTPHTESSALFHSRHALSYWVAPGS